LHEPLTATDFAALMCRSGPLEPAPHIGVAVSGGGDSMALLLLAVEWVGLNGGRLTALTVDHGLRPESSAEAAIVAQWCRRMGCDHETLVWRRDGVPVTGALQELARNARYHLLQGAAARLGILHLLLAHHAGDQAETIAMRASHGSGEDGLAGMAAILALDHVRILRPLLEVPVERLRQTCRDRGHDWIEDPSNHAVCFERVRVRQALAAGLEPINSLGFAARRAERERQLAMFLARTATLHPTGHASLDADIARATPVDILPSCIGHLLRTIGNRMYMESRDSLRRLAGAIRQPGFRGATLGGCRLRPDKAKIVVTPEHRGGYPAWTKLEPGSPAYWASFEIASTMRCKVAEVGGNWPGDRPKPFLSDIVRMQPGFYDESGLLAAPTLGYVRKGSQADAWTARFAPKRSLVHGIFPIV
jgi:tRNA(Ile)-lysidine synthase